MRVLVTGCMGFIGSNTVAHLLNAGYSVLGFDNLSNPSIDPTDRIKAATVENWSKFKFYNQDIRGLDGMISICMNEKVDSIVHLAAVGSVQRSFETPSNTIDVNERGFSNMLCLASAIGVKRVVFASSSSVYGDSKKVERMEGEEGSPISPYALTKRSNEILAKIWGQKTGMELIGLRFFNVYGQGQRPDSPYSAVIPRFCTEKELVIYGNGTQTRDFTFVGDVAKAIGAALTTEHHSFCVNVGTGEGTSINELASQVSGTRPIIYKKERTGDVKDSIASVRNLKRILNFMPETSLSEGLKVTKEYYQCLIQMEAQEGHSKKESPQIQKEALP